MEIIDRFNTLMTEMSCRKQNPIIIGYERVCYDLKQKLEQAQANTLYLCIEDIPNFTEMVMIGNQLYLKVWTGDLIIDRIFYDTKIYTIINPLVLHSVSLLVNAHGTTWRLNPKGGFHTLHDGSLCLGDYHPQRIHQWETAKTEATNIRKLLSGINCDSLGEVALPPEYKDWIQIKNNTKDFLDSLLKQKTIKEVSKWT